MKKKKNEKLYLFKEKKKITQEILDIFNELVNVLSPGKGVFDHLQFLELVENPLLDMYFLEVEGKIIGMGCLHYVKTPVKKSAWVESMVVHPNHQRKGYGKKITDHIISEAKKRGVNYIELTSRPQRVAANAFYKKMNFELRDTGVYRLMLKK